MQRGHAAGKVYIVLATVDGRIKRRVRGRVKYRSEDAKGRSDRYASLAYFAEHFVPFEDRKLKRGAEAMAEKEGE